MVCGGAASAAHSGGRDVYTQHDARRQSCSRAATALQRGVGSPDMGTGMAMNGFDVRAEA